MKKPNFILSRKNQQGQVAIFVALIFQVIFVFFALLINVGLLVHHKINLQQSTDLAAYYGAMKQAESLNAMAHVNYQLRQGWKLLTWRYRVLGTFGLQHTDDFGQQPLMPVTLLYGAGTQSKINNDAEFQAGKCPTGANTADTPFFCIAHGGMNGWMGGDKENICKVNCPVISEAAYQVSGVSSPGLSAHTADAIVLKKALDGVNLNLTNLCSNTGKANIRVLARIITAYRQDMLIRSQLMQMLAGNLSNEAKDLLDLDGNKVIDGATKTLKNNLTEANNSSDEIKINFYNSLSSDECKIDKSNPASNHALQKKEFIKRIEFDFINFFIHDCVDKSTKTSTNLDYIAGSIFKSDLTGLSNGSPGNNSSKTPNVFSQDAEDAIMPLIATNDQKFTVGYEKNPWCPAYFVVQAKSKPRIPFLPISEIQINAVSVAKPFGGSLGPWYGKTWDKNAATTQQNLAINDDTKQTDELLPTVNRPTVPPKNLKESGRLVLNFSRFVGDQKGVSDIKYLAEYHAALINRVPTVNNTTLYGSSMELESTGINTISSPTNSPALSSWDNTSDLEDPRYDPLTRGSGDKTSFLRNLEISAVTPNQFDLTYFSIEPDYYNNYYKRLSDPTIFSKLKNAAGGLGPNKPSYVKPDFGNNKAIYPDMKEFSVKNQIEIYKKIFVDPPFSTNLKGSAPWFTDAYPEITKKQSSLLTGWTFLNLTDFNTFPGTDMTSPTQTMNFARCNDPWQNVGSTPDYKNPTEINSKFPPTPGNCVTGGRVGYSVKLVSPSSLSQTMAPQPLGGPNTSDVIWNPIPNSLLNNF